MGWNHLWRKYSYLYWSAISMDFFNISISFFNECFVFISHKRLKEWSFRKNANPLCTLMEPFGLGHVVNERFALEVRKVHGQGREGRIQNWSKKILKSKLQFYPSKISEKKSVNSREIFQVFHLLQAFASWNCTA